MNIVFSVVGTMLMVIFFLILIMSFKWTRNLAGLGGVAPTGIAGSLSNAVGS